MDFLDLVLAALMLSALNSMVRYTLQKDRTRSPFW